jgi:phosphoribosylaminoimidazolecarboxamide formyltransferase/IMP cyclohydrolase
MPIQRALLSVFDKTNLLPFARALAERGVELLSTGGTHKALQAEGLPVRSVEDFTGSPEVMAGRVKTLHPRVHGGILARRGVDEADLLRLGAAPIDLVVVNLYPFERTLRSGADHGEIIENIDIGGPAMLRSAAKNHADVAVICDPADYAAALEELGARGDLSLATRRRLAAKVYAHTAAYDGLIASYLSSINEDDSREEYPRYWFTASELAYPLRYGENPHQSGAFYRERGAQPGALALAESLGAGGKELSFNNLVDVNAALEAVREFEEPAYRLAREADALSAFGGIVALNRPVDGAAAALLVETFLECVVAPSFDDEALALLRGKKNLRLLAVGGEPWASPLDIKRVGGGFVVQQRDATGAEEVRGGKVVTRRAPTAEELASLGFAWRVCKHVKSNAIVLARGQQTVGVGAGQMSRVVSVELACTKAGELARGSVLASDAFFPFADGVEAALARGVTAIAQPGGSVRDAEVIAAADAAGAAMVFTGARHFRH